MAIAITLETISVQSRIISKALKSLPYVLEVLKQQEQSATWKVTSHGSLKLISWLIAPKAITNPTVIITITIIIALSREDKSPFPSLIKL